ncbi:MAG: aminotransferase class I/II-fold pyridoxal phosphate-dependent enzyme [Gemmatimonadetes bacterium]|nr:aminotransferase class I/II-fold pyridoxal phosphate-dependent enzyme [Gemmatimonadota bacterium]NIR80964.1 aminotransferase class I/II-fold pyridoxal phosphate-dependent enzyme [Gemmatimonadota bacterium]NIT89782.1 aminotransferase class I/II-fold pyridoxal phosphate-dependent enzyme [Gemmatimonadota bacterium]NIU33568.1 aminotransferase class I/II-fold pyridoxal phosphate-dependent enzyme [Gemmatimonadota bacterium]NIU37837.1 aminotransferase class I/II-fold pyridoxal phosphate-dependent e
MGSDPAPEEDPAPSSSEPSPSSLELSPERFRRIVEEATGRIVSHLEGLDAAPAVDLEGAEELARSLVEDLPSRGEPLEALLDRLFGEIVPKSFNTAGPGYLAYIPGGGILHAAVADLIADAVNRYVGIWPAAPGLVRLEANVVRWFCEMVGYGEGSGGFMTSGGSHANLSAITTARRDLLGDEFLRGTVYTSDQVHHSVTKAAVLAGLPARSVRKVPSDECFRIRTDVLEERVRADRDEGLDPFLVVGSAGTVNTGAVDDLEALVDLCRRHGLWLHVDGAYGGFFVLTERGREAMRGIERADSVTLDPHKGLFLPYGTGSLVVKDTGRLERAHRTEAEYIEKERGPGVVDFADLSPELTRPFRGLRVWLPMKMHGADAFRTLLDEKIDLARRAADALEATEGVEVVARPQLSLLAFRLAPDGVGGDALDALNRRFLEAINRRRRVFLSATRLRGRYTLRICVLSFRTHRERVEEGIEDIRDAAREVLSESSSP